MLQTLILLLQLRCERSKRASEIEKVKISGGILDSADEGKSVLGVKNTSFIFKFNI